RDRAATSAQAKMSALVVGLMPLAFFAIVGSGARDQLRVLVGDPIGWALLASGVVLEAGGARWMRALLRPRRSRSFTRGACPAASVSPSVGEPDCHSRRARIAPG